MSEIIHKTSKMMFARGSVDPGNALCSACKAPTNRVVASKGVVDVQWQVLFICDDCFFEMCRLYQEVEKVDGVRQEGVKILLPT